MREDFLHFIWKYKKLQLDQLLSSKNEVVQVLDVGTHNLLAGPDFFNAKIKIDEQLWAGNVEMHIKSSDWYAHHHERDPNYQNVILHVVWEDDCDVFRIDNSIIPTLILKNYISPNILQEYQKLFHQKKQSTFLNCNDYIANVDDFVLQNWLEVLYFERLEKKAQLVNKLLLTSNNDWEEVFFIMLFKNFGSKINGDNFFVIAKDLGFSLIRKVQGNTLQLESVFYGLAGLLQEDIVGDVYYNRLKSEFHFLTTKFQLNGSSPNKVAFFKLRPTNFPTIRLSQLANLYSLHQNLFSKVMEVRSVADMYKIFNISASEYWNNHYTFGKITKKFGTKLTKKFIDLLIINTILPVKLSYAKQIGKDVNEEIIRIISDLSPEHNSVIAAFKQLKLLVPSAKESQSILQLYTAYCTKNKCLQCAVGHQLLNRKA